MQHTAGKQPAEGSLTSTGADPNLATKAGGATALHRACYMGHEAVAELL